MESNEQVLPQARTIDVVIREMPEEVLVYDLKGHKAHCLNKTAATIWRYCDGETTIAMMAQSLSQDLSATVSEEVVWLALEQLGKSGLLTQIIVKPETVAGVSRRQMMRRIGWTGVMVPLVTSIIAPSAQAANTCVGQSCSPAGTGAPQCTCTGCCAQASSGAPNTCRPFHTVPNGGFCSHDCQCSSGQCNTGLNECKP